MTKLRSFRTRRTQYINENLEDVDVEGKDPVEGWTVLTDKDTRVRLCALTLKTFGSCTRSQLFTSAVVTS